LLQHYESPLRGTAAKPLRVQLPLLTTHKQHPQGHQAPQPTARRPTVHLLARVEVRGRLRVAIVSATPYFFDVSHTPYFTANAICFANTADSNCLLRVTTALYSVDHSAPHSSLSLRDGRHLEQLGRLHLRQQLESVLRRHVSSAHASRTPTAKTWTRAPGTCRAGMLRSLHHPARRQHRCPQPPVLVVDGPHHRVPHGVALVVQTVEGDVATPRCRAPARMHSLRFALPRHDCIVLSSPQPGGGRGRTDNCSLRHHPANFRLFAWRPATF